ncbi:IS200/IS605 family element transposase accessory protein TnpB [Aneurinibacillus migulanus]|nr:IS200/IS605 family element transposase accessory protein TnpB [Aneurinibacillus migulanus]MED0892375.1 IS200/IS605 family element transposase accessory protein TnpB [Aneurinibacillus migulanus]MED1615672.1 IS200/IS605 family element transposase accessory protein TnpB [Aneurinibacillus migulanus]
MDTPCAPAEKRRSCLFPTAPAHRPSFFSYLSPQEFVDVSNQMYIAKAISEVPWYQFRTMLEYKAKWYGRTVVSIANGTGT